MQAFAKPRKEVSTKLQLFTKKDAENGPVDVGQDMKLEGIYVYFIYINQQKSYKYNLIDNFSFCSRSRPVQVSVQMAD